MIKKSGWEDNVQNWQAEQLKRQALAALKHIDVPSILAELNTQDLLANIPKEELLGSLKPSDMTGALTSEQMLGATPGVDVLKKYWPVLAGAGALGLGAGGAIGAGLARKKKRPQTDKIASLVAKTLHARRA